MRIEVGSTVVIPVPSLSRATEMWKNVKALEEENKRLRKELEEWVKKALELSKRLRASGAPMAVNSVAQMHALFKSARAAPASKPAAQASESASSSSSSFGRAANDSRFPQASSDVSGRRESGVRLASERPSEPSTAR